MNELNLSHFLKILREKKIQNLLQKKFLISRKKKMV